MSEYTEVEQPFLQQPASLGWTIIDQGREIPRGPSRSHCQTFRQWILSTGRRQDFKAIPGSP